ncbi:DNA adenine methylase [Saccharopolyspora sp. 7B]|uniref:DNA adenine methylase n=1 Tax=Saccharopolyspora sp. 7B TaxID=2877240 RepID=UPI001CD3749E|nr:DNA adenine methylase [Saccharopolyspora sp. 7B]MCA1282185.1 DNA adenine methylase [Saccharopolyspora sp. 7B]
MIADAETTAPISVRVTGRTRAASPLRYPGGKAALAGFFGDIIGRLETPPTTYVEPYAGGVGAGIALLKQDRVQNLVINDIDPAVYCFWKSAVQNADQFATLVQDTPLDVEEWRRQKAIYRAADETNSLALGFAFFYLNRTNRSGILNAGPIGGVKQLGNYKIDARFNRDQLADRIASIGNLRYRIKVQNVDGISVAQKYISDDSAFVYIDPPYVDMGGSLYLNSFTHRDHADLATALGNQPDGNWVVTYDPSDFIRNLYSQYDTRDYQLSYSAHRTGKASELMITSRRVAKLLASAEDEQLREKPSEL